MALLAVLVILALHTSNASTSSANINLDGISPCPPQESQTRAVPVTFVADTRLPTDVGQFRLRAYRIDAANPNEHIGTEPCVIYCATKSPFGSDGKLMEGVPIRVHDQCMTSEVFRSQRCDCKEQLKLAMEYIRDNGGAIIYLQQEGRGIGLANKVAAYAMQDAGCDTVDANRHLGFPDDARQYGVVPSILADMQIGSIQLLSNNPRKLEKLTAMGVEVIGMVPVVIPETNPYNQQYLATKQTRMNHENLDSLFAKTPGKHMLPRAHLSRAGASDR